MFKLRATSIDFDTDGDNKLAALLSKEWVNKIVTVDADNIDAASDLAVDSISDESGWLVNGWSYEEVK